MRMIIVGPCGIGKSTIAKLIAYHKKIECLDLDELKLTGQVNRLPCSISYLNLKECLKDILDRQSHGFVLDIGGGTVFRKDRDNTERLQQVLWLKQAYEAKIIVLFAQQQTVQRRFLSVKSRKIDEFTKVWEAWLKIEKPFWQQCADHFIDTT